MRRKFVTEIEGTGKSSSESQSPPTDQHVEEVSVSAQVELSESDSMATSMATAAAPSSRGESSTEEAADTTRQNSISSPNQTFATPDAVSPHSPSPNDIDALVDKAVSKVNSDLRMFSFNQFIQFLLILKQINLQFYMLIESAFERFAAVETLAAALAFATLAHCSAKSCLLQRF